MLDTKCAQVQISDLVPDDESSVSMHNNRPVEFIMMSVTRFVSSCILVGICELYACDKLIRGFLELIQTMPR